MPMSEATVPSTVTRDCPLCGATLDPANPSECPKCDWVLGYRRQQVAAEGANSGRDLAALLMSVVPGLGHIYKGQKVNGVIFMGGILLVVGLSVVFATATVLASFLMIPVYWSGVMLHAYWAEDRALQRL